MTSVVTATGIFNIGPQALPRTFNKTKRSFKNTIKQEGIELWIDYNLLHCNDDFILDSIIR